MKILSLLLFAVLLPHFVFSGHLQIIPNLGQWEKDVQFKAPLSSGRIFWSKQTVTFLFWDAHQLAHLRGHKHEHEESNTLPPFTENLSCHAYQMTFLNADHFTHFLPEKPYKHYNNYYYDRQKSVTNVPIYETVLQKSIYKGIDIHWYQIGENLKYDYIVAPYSDVQQIQVNYEGIDRIKLLANGNLYLKTSLAEITETAPFAYQVINGKKQSVKCRYKLQNNTVSYEFPQGYRKDLPLIIDPTLIFSSYSGSTADNWGNTATYDSEGNFYLGGTVFDVGFPATTGAFDVTFNGIGQRLSRLDVGIMKFSPDGKQLLYATYLGGTDAEVPHSLLVDNSNNLLVMGTTSSLNFPVTPQSFDTSFNGGVSQTIIALHYANGSDLFIAKFSATGNQLLASTFLGGSQNDGLMTTVELARNYGDEIRGDIITDEQNNIYVVSYTFSTDFPITPNAAQTTHGGNLDACVLKMSSHLDNLIWSTYLGGAEADAAYSIQINKLKNIVIAGGTRSNNFPTTNTPVLHNTFQGGISDGFVAILQSDGSNLLTTTFIGTSLYDQTYFVQLDTNDHVYVLGQTSGNYPISQEVYRNTNARIFIHKLSPDLNSTVFSTVVGKANQPSLVPTAFLIDECEQIYISGWGGIVNASTGYLGGNLTGFPVTSNARQGNTDGSDFYFMQLSKDAINLKYATFFGGTFTAGGTIISREHVDGGTSRFDKKGIIYQAVCAGCGGNSLFPATAGVWSNNNASDNCNMAGIKFDFNRLKASFTTSVDSITAPLCTPFTVTFFNKSEGGTQHVWNFGNGNSITTTDTTPVVQTFTQSGNYPIRLQATNPATCLVNDFAFDTLFFNPSPPTFDTTIRFCPKDTIKIQHVKIDSSYIVRWTPTDFLSDFTIPNPIIVAESNVSYRLTLRDTNDCISRSNVELVSPQPRPLRFETQLQYNGCKGLPILLLKNINYAEDENYTWYFNQDSVQNDEPEWKKEITAEGIYEITLKSSKEECTTIFSKTINIQPLIAPNVISVNEDGKNDFFEIQPKQEGYSFEVYNRWGKLLYKNKNYQNEWKPSDLTTGIYYYLIIAADETRCKGWLQILR
jgi:gliding motility-associated-like protein